MSYGFTSDGPPLAMRSMDMLSFYKARCANFDLERDELIDRVKELEIPRRELLMSRWELRVAREKARELQQSLSDCTLEVAKLRDRTLCQEAEIERLKIKCEAQRKTIVNLTALTQPAVSQWKPVRRSNQRTEQSQAEEEGATSRSRLGPVSQQLYGMHGIGNVYVETSERERSLENLVLSLTRQLEAVKRNGQELSEDLTTRMAEMETHLANQDQVQSRKINELEEKLSISEERRLRALKEYLKKTHEFRQEEDRYRQQCEDLSKKLVSMKEDLKRNKYEVLLEATAARTSIKEETERVLADYRSRCQLLEETNLLVKEQYREVQRKYKQKLELSRERQNILQQKLKKLERKRNLELEGYMTDLSQLRQNVERLELASLEWVLASNNPAAGPRMPSSIERVAEVIKAKLQRLENELQYESASAS